MTAISLDQVLASPDDRRLDLLQEADDPDATLLRLGDEAERLAFAEPGRAIDAATVIVELADVTGGPRVQARARRARAQTLAYAGRFDEALACCDDAIRIATAASERVEAARARLASLHSLAHLGRFEEAFAAGEAARVAFLDSAEPELAGRADLNLGAVHAMRDNPREALRHLDRAIQALAGDPLLLAQSESNRGNAFMSLDDFRAAEDAFQRAANGFAEGGHPTAAAIAEGNLAYLAARQGLLQPALAHYERARRLLEGDEARSHRLRLLAEQADALLALGMPRQAKEEFERVLPDLEQLGLVVEAARAKAGLGQAHRRLDEIAEAEETLYQVSTAFSALGHAGERARVDLARAELHALRGERAQAKQLAGGALADLGDRPANAAVAHTVLAAIAMEDGDLDVAAGELAAALGPAHDLRLSPVLATLHLLRGRLNRTRQRVEPALADFRASIAEVERIRGTLQAERFRSAYLGSRLDAYDELVSLALEDPTSERCAEAFGAVESCKSRTLLDLLDGGSDPSRTDSGDSEGDAALRRRIAELRAELNWHYSRLADAGPGEIQDRGGAIRDVAAMEEELARLEDRQAMTHGAGSVLAPAMLADIQVRLPATTALIEYYIAGDEVLAFLVCPERVQVHRRLTTLIDLDQRLRRWRFQIGRGLATPQADGPRAERMLRDARRELGDLNAELLAPMRSHLAGVERLIIVPHGPLHALPFHALWDGTRYLLDACEVSYAPSAGIYARLATRPAVALSQAPLVVGVEDELAPGIAEEIRRVAPAIGAADVLAGAEATAERVTAAAAGVPLLHLACHGRFSAAFPATSGLKLHDRWLTPREIAALPLVGAHVTLSACDTGRSQVQSGDELLGLARAFFTAGASSILMSLWSVHDATVVDLMTDFYGLLRNGESRARALRSAQVACRERQPHPALWAPFVLGGQP
ncbi:MAG: CHAT domain-containing protein [Thermomicrobiales bacterium]